MFLPLRPRQPGHCASPCLQSPLLFCVRSHLLVSLCLTSSRSSLESSPSPAGHAQGGWSRWERGQRPPSLPGRASGTPPLSGEGPAPTASSSCVCYTSEDICCSDEIVTNKRLPGICNHPRGVLSPEKGSLSQILRKGNRQFGHLMTHRPPGVPARGWCLPPWEQNVSWPLASGVPSAPRTCQCDEVSPPWLSSVTWHGGP